MARYVILDNTGTVINIVEWDGVAPWVLLAGQTHVLESELLKVAPKADQEEYYVPDVPIAVDE